jgi:hypothetical protein
MTALTEQTHLELSRDQIATTLDHEVVILNTHTGRYFTLSGIGTKVWELLQTTQTPQQLQQIILETYDVSEARCQQDLFKLLGEMHHAGLISGR